MPTRSAPAAVPVPDPVLEPTPAAAPVWTAEDAWDDKAWDEEITEPTPAPAPAVAPEPAVGARPALDPYPAALPGDGLAVPARRTVALFPPIRAGGGRHRLPAAVRRRPGPIAAGLMVAATTLAAGTLRLSAPLPVHSAASTGHQCGPLLPGEPCG
ncbi:hypothetical protein ACEZDB_31695 [Streptacidiphilus sp. N1-3]|uniref:Uncharacterized protein n=1 Tax=Streptacidiphilus alkalitolerans TaxID=3342712 RepID=A0ABV6XAD6_9ACTN